MAETGIAGYAFRDPDHFRCRPAFHKLFDSPVGETKPRFKIYDRLARYTEPEVSGPYDAGMHRPDRDFEYTLALYPPEFVFGGLA